MIRMQVQSPELLRQHRERQERRARLSGVKPLAVRTPASRPVQPRPAIVDPETPCPKNATLEAAIDRLRAEARKLGRTLPAPNTRRDWIILALPDEPRRVTVKDIQNIVAEAYGATVADMVSHRMSRPIVMPRMIAMHLARSLTAQSLPEIGRRFGGRDHTTVRHAVHKIGQLIEVDADLAMRVQQLRERLEVIND